MRLTKTFTNALDFVSLQDFGVTWATVHDSGTLNGGPFANNLTNNAQGGLGIRFDGTNYTVRKFLFHFNLGTDIPVDAVIQSAFLRIPGTATTFENIDSDTVNVVASLVASNTALATSDWANIGATSFGSLALSAFTGAGNNDIALNATGLAALQSAIGGYAKLGIRSARDIANTAPSGENNATFNLTGLLLSITYDVPDGALFFSHP